MSRKSREDILKSEGFTNAKKLSESVKELMNSFNDIIYILKEIMFWKKEGQGRGGRMDSQRRKIASSKGFARLARAEEARDDRHGDLTSI